MSGKVLPATPAARRIAQERGIDLSLVKGSGEYGSVMTRDLEGFHAAPRTTGTARGMANYYDISLESVVPSQGGRIGKADVAAMVSGSQNSVMSTIPSGEDEIIPLSGMRKVIAERMLESMSTQPQYTMCAELDTTAVFEFLAQAKDAFKIYGQGKLTFTDVMVKITARALMEHPKINTSLVGDQIIRHANVHMGIAVALDEGLIVPVIRNANMVSLHSISKMGQDLFSRARNGKLMPEEYKGSTFSISNLGNYPVDFSTPIINSPEGGILGISKTDRKPVVRNEEIVIRTMTGFSLTLDHRVIDGIEGAKFLKTFDEMLQQPSVVLIDN